MKIEIFNEMMIEMENKMRIGMKMGMGNAIGIAIVTAMRSWIANRREIKMKTRMGIYIRIGMRI